MLHRCWVNMFFSGKNLSDFGVQLFFLELDQLDHPGATIELPGKLTCRCGQTMVSENMSVCDLWSSGLWCGLIVVKWKGCQIPARLISSFFLKKYRKHTYIYIFQSFSIALIPQKSEAEDVSWKQGGPENPKARRHTARFFWKSCGVCSARNRRKIFTETSCALMVSGAAIHHSMLCQLRLHSSSRYFC